MPWSAHATFSRPHTPVPKVADSRQGLPTTEVPVFKPNHWLTRSIEAMEDGEYDMADEDLLVPGNDELLSPLGTADESVFLSPAADAGPYDDLVGNNEVEIIGAGLDADEEVMGKTDPGGSAAMGTAVVLCSFWTELRARSQRL
jgi:hypothetical protein